MDERRAHLVAAALAVRTWVHAQRATWTDGSMANFPALRAPAFAPGVSRVGIPVAAVAIPDMPELAAHSALPSLRVLSSFGAPILQRFWRVGLAAAIVLACTGTARVYWPVWTKALKAQLAAAGEYAAVFARPKAPAVDRPTAVTGRSPAPRADAVPRRSGRLQVDSNPVGAHVLIDGQDRGITPLTVKDLTVGGHTVVLRGDEGEVQRTISIGADKTTQLNEAIYSGWLHVSSPVELQMSEGTRSVRLDDSNQVLLPPGPHEVRFENRTFGFVEVKKFEVRPGDTTSISVVPPASTLSITASTPAEVLIDGTLIGGTPLTDYALPVGTRDLTVRNASGAERRMMLTITVDPVRLEVDFSKP